MENQRKSLSLTIGWVLLLILGVAIAGAGLASLMVAYRGTNDRIAETGFKAMAKMDPDLPNAIRGRRATAATWAISCGLLLCWIALTAFRRGEKWAWLAVGTSLGAGCLLSLLRVPILELRAGAAAAGIVLGILFVALLVSYRNFK
jgi:hypothetical protein